MSASSAHRWLALRSTAPQVTLRRRLRQHWRVVDADSGRHSPTLDGVAVQIIVSSALARFLQPICGRQRCNGLWCGGARHGTRVMMMIGSTARGIVGRGQRCRCGGRVHGDIIAYDARFSTRKTGRWRRLSGTVAIPEVSPPRVVDILGRRESPKQAFRGGWHIVQAHNFLTSFFGDSFQWALQTRHGR